MRAHRRVAVAALAASMTLGAFVAPSPIGLVRGAGTESVALAAPEQHGKHAKQAKHASPPKKGPRARPRKVAQRRPPPPPPLEGTTYDYDYDGKDVGHTERRWMGRAFVHKKAAALAGHALPILVFLHGNNAEAIKYRWMGGGSEGDVRRMVSELMEAGAVPPMIVAGPSSVDPYTMKEAGASWPSFDLDVFLDRTIERLGPAASIDRGRVVVAAHSGGGCNIRGGLNTALHAKSTPVLAGMSIDTCMLYDLAKSLAHLRPTTNVVVAWQSISWPERDFGGFKTVFQRESKKAPAAPGVLRELDFVQPTVPGAHDALVSITLKKWLPKILPPDAVPVDLDAQNDGRDGGAAHDGG
jgi:hypothetical protein